MYSMVYYMEGDEYPYLWSKQYETEAEAFAEAISALRYTPLIERFEVYYEGIVVDTIDRDMF